MHEKIENGALGLPAEIYLLDDVVILQVRTGLRFGRKKDFVKEFQDNLKKYFLDENSCPMFLF